jgi:hypothetical protein
MSNLPFLAESASSQRDEPIASSEDEFGQSILPNSWCIIEKNGQIQVVILRDPTQLEGAKVLLNFGNVESKTPKERIAWEAQNFSTEVLADSDTIYLPLEANTIQRFAISEIFPQLMKSENTELRSLATEILSKNLQIAIVRDDKAGVLFYLESPSPLLAQIQAIPDEKIMKDITQRITDSRFLSVSEKTASGYHYVGDTVMFIQGEPSPFSIRVNKTDDAAHIELRHLVYHNPTEEVLEKSDNSGFIFFEGIREAELETKKRYEITVIPPDFDSEKLPSYTLQELEDLLLIYQNGLRELLLQGLPFFSQRRDQQQEIERLKHSSPTSSEGNQLYEAEKKLLQIERDLRALVYQQEKVKNVSSAIEEIIGQMKLYEEEIEAKQRNQEAPVKSERGRIEQADVLYILPTAGIGDQVYPALGAVALARAYPEKTIYLQEKSKYLLSLDDVPDCPANLFLIPSNQSPFTRDSSFPHLNDFQDKKVAVVNFTYTESLEVILAKKHGMDPDKNAERLSTQFPSVDVIERPEVYESQKSAGSSSNISSLTSPNTNYANCGLLVSFDTRPKYTEEQSTEPLLNQYITLQTYLHTVLGISSEIIKGMAKDWPLKIETREEKLPTSTMYDLLFIVDARAGNGSKLFDPKEFYLALDEIINQFPGKKIGIVQGQDNPHFALEAQALYPQIDCIFGSLDQVVGVAMRAHNVFTLDTGAMHEVNAAIKKATYVQSSSNDRNLGEESHIPNLICFIGEAAGFSPECYRPDCGTTLISKGSGHDFHHEDISEMVAKSFNV